MKDQQETPAPPTASTPRARSGDELPQRKLKITRKMIIMGATSSRDWQPIHHDSQWAREQAGLPDIIMNNYTQAGWLSQYLTSWGGPQARMARLGFAMRSPLCPGDEAEFSARILNVTDDAGYDRVELELAIAVGERIATTATATLVLPGNGAARSPWELGGPSWQP